MLLLYCLTEAWHVSIVGLTLTVRINNPFWDIDSQLLIISRLQLDKNYIKTGLKFDKKSTMPLCIGVHMSSASDFSCKN